MAKQEKAAQERIAQGLKGLLVIPPHGDVKPKEVIAMHMDNLKKKLSSLFYLNHYGDNYQKNDEVINEFPI